MKKRIVSMLLVIALVLTAVLGLTACSDGVDGVTPQLRINAETNFWEVSYDGGATWVSMEVKATGADGVNGVDGEDGKNGTDGADGKNGINGKDGVNGKDGIDGVDGADGKNGANGTNGVDGTDGKDGVNGTDGKDGADGKDAVAPQIQINAETNEWEVSCDNGITWTSLGVKATGAAGVDGTNGITPSIGEDGYWYIGETCTNVYAGKTQKVKVTFREFGSEYTAEIFSGSKVNYYVPEADIASFVNWYSDSACTKPFNFNTEINSDATVYVKWDVDTANKEGIRQAVGRQLETLSFGKASCMGTSNCFGSVYYRVLSDAHDYYDGAKDIANYLKGVFVESEGVVSVSSTSGLRRISYTDALTVINFASAFSSYQEYILRNGMTMPEDIAAQKTLAIKYFETVDYTATGYNTHSGGGMSFPSMAVAVVALGSLMEQHGTARFDTLIKAAYDNLDTAFYNPGMYLQPFYQLCAHYGWYDKGSLETEVKALTSLTTANVLKYYGYGIDLANDHAELWNAFVAGALADGKLDASEAKAFAYHYAYQEAGSDAWLGAYGSSRAIVDFGSTAD